MRRLLINGVNIDIDNETSIGIDLQNYDIKEPAKNKVKISNSFTIPITNNNLNAIGWIGGRHNLSTSIYSDNYCDYYVNNVAFITNARVRIEGISNRISLYVFEKPTIWDTLKKVSYQDFIEGYFAWLNVPKAASPLNVSFTNFIAPYLASGGANGLFIPYLKGNTRESTLQLELFLSFRDSNEFISGSHVCTYIKSIFEYIEDTYSVSFNTGGTFEYNIFNDPIVEKMTLLVRDIMPTSDMNFDFGYFFELSKNTTTGEYTYAGFDEVPIDETRDKTLFDLVLSILQKFNVIITQVDNTTFKLRRFDDMANVDVIDFSGMLTGKPIFKPFVDGYAQNNFIKYKDFEEGISELTLSKNITCLNKNIEVNADLFTIDAFIPSFTNEDEALSEYVPIVYTKKSLENFKFFIEGNSIPETVTLKITANSFVSTTASGMIAAALYDLNSEYNLLTTAMQYPVYYEVQKWLTPLDILNIDFFKLYYFKELGGAFFINKIKGFNPELSKQATTLELIKISDKTPLGEYVEYSSYTDGLDNIFTDGLGNKYI